MPVFRKVLIANRGEIAVRIARTLREMGIGVVAVYAEPDATALHVIHADEAVPIGGREPATSYLDIDRILWAARKSGAEAIHPGYGFLAENAEFARRVQEAGLVFIGPTPEAMEALGDKVQARRIARKAGVPVVPGTLEGLRSPEEGLRLAREIGFPVLLKAARGGGGKGMRVVRRPEDFAEAFRLASQEAASAFGDPTLFLEKYIEHPRHVEIQVLGDHHGGVIHLYERECSMQRRHQKIIEETPSPAIDEPTRRAMGEAAVALAREAGYTNAGTVEFMVDPEGRFYFLEVNTRLQVEHPITELTVGMDLVREQVRIASGARLSLAQGEVRKSGHAIEARVYAEDPQNRFLPSPGRIHFLLEPGGPGIRVDSGVYPGYEIPVYYDPLIAKVIAYGRDREEARRRLVRALREYRIFGPVTNLLFLIDLLESPAFVEGSYDTWTVEAEEWEAPPPEESLAILGALGGAEPERGEEDRHPAALRESAWKRLGRLMAMRGSFRP